VNDHSSQGAHVANSATRLLWQKSFDDCDISDDRTSMESIAQQKSQVLHMLRYMTLSRLGIALQIIRQLADASLWFSKVGNSVFSTAFVKRGAGLPFSQEKKFSCKKSSIIEDLSMHFKGIWGNFGA
jgi:hypothetical protein